MGLWENHEVLEDIVKNVGFTKTTEEPEHVQLLCGQIS